MRYSIVSAYFVPWRGLIDPKKLPVDIKKLIKQLPLEFDTLDEKIQVHEIIDPREGERKDLVLMIKDNETGSTTEERFTEPDTGKKIIHINFLNGQ